MCSHLQQECFDVCKLVFPEPLHPHHPRSELSRQVGQDDDVVALGVDLEDADVGQGDVGVLGLEEGIQPDSRDRQTACRPDSSIGSIGPYQGWCQSFSHSNQRLNLSCRTHFQCDC